MRNNITRKYITGEDWLYAKIYTGPESADAFLTKEIYAIVKDTAAGGHIQNFYFVRYADESGNHLRLRFHLTEAKHYVHIIDNINRQFRKHVRDQIVHTIVYDTYFREIERYSPEYIGDAEIIFGISSWMIIKQLRANATTDNRWTWGAAIMNVLLTAFGMNNEEKHSVHEDYFKVYTMEFGFSKERKLLLGKKYREFSKDILTALEQCSPGNPLLFIHKQVPFIDKQKISNAFNNPFLRNNTYLNYNNTQKQIIQGIMHMHYNRLFLSQQRSAEYIIYYILSKIYKSLTIIGRHNKALQ